MVKMKMKIQKSMLVALSLMLLMTSASFGVAYEVTGTSPASDPSVSIDTVSEDDNSPEYPAGRLRVDDVGVYLYPEKQFAELGEWKSYELVIKDNHLPRACDVEKYSVDDTQDKFSEDVRERLDCPAVLATYQYKLYYEASEGALINLDQESVILSAGEKTTIKFSVQSKKSGANYFAIMVSGEESATGAKGVLVVGEKLIPPRVESAFFGGDGFAVSEDGSRGVLVNIKLLKYGENELRGKFHIDGRTFDARGEISGDRIKLSLEMIGRNFPPYEVDPRAVSDDEAFPNTGARRGEVSIRGSFVGTVSDYKTFSLLEGDLSLGDMSGYRLTAASKNIRSIRDIPVEQEISVAVNELLVLDSQVAETSLSKFDTESFSKDDVYIRPYRVRAEKFLWIFSTGKKILEVEVIRGDEVSVKKIREGGSEIIEGYSVTVGSLEDEDNIELNVEKTVEE